MENNTQDFINMQKDWYEDNASNSVYSNGTSIRDQIVGNFSHHENFPYEELLFKYYKPDKTHICFEYGCGPGRQIRRLLPFFKRVDGVDLSQSNLNNAKDYIGDGYNGILALNDGMSVPLEDSYDFCYSVICLQHIPVYDIRRQIIDNMYDKLKDGGSICIQLAFGPSVNGTPTFSYDDNYCDAERTNGRFDCRVDSAIEVISDFNIMGFKEINTELSDTVCDHHPKWIWVYGKK